MRCLPVFLFAAALAQAQNPDYPVTAHLRKALRTHTSQSSYNAQNDEWSHGAANGHTSELVIGNIVYITANICKAAEVGKDYPAKVDGKHIRLLVGDKECKYRVVGEEEK
jgi:hypothetical protein